MRISKKQIEEAHKNGLYIDRLTGETYPAIPRQEFINKVEKLYPHHSERLFHCQARIVYCEYSTEFNCAPILLQSYNTYVAMYMPTTDRLFVFDYYSPNTCQHIAKFNNFIKLFSSYWKVPQFNCYRRVRDKNGSHIEYEPFIPFT